MFRPHESEIPDSPRLAGGRPPIGDTRPGLLTRLPGFPIRMGQKVRQPDTVACAHHDGRVGEIGVVDLGHKLPAATTRRKHDAVAAHGDDLGDAAFAGGDHRRNGAMFGTKPDPAADVDADAQVEVAGRAEESTGDIAGRIVLRERASEEPRFR